MSKRLVALLAGIAMLSTAVLAQSAKAAPAPPKSEMIYFVMLDRFANQYLQNYEPEKNEALYMITAFDATSKGVKDLKATIHHGDHSLRPQIVTKKSNLAYYRLINEFSRLTGVGAL
ncbi:MAG: hypothetical protein EBR90_03690, partial [Actinobacteria bacterium]|nr:hypothetical protein [Actinomycetota bacterium]